MKTKKKAAKTAARPSKTIKPRKNYAAIANALGARVAWALKFLRNKDNAYALAGSVLPTGDVESIEWEEWFMDGLDMIGYTIDRKAYYKRFDKRRR